MKRNRQEHLDWCKMRALEYVDRNQLSEGWVSMCSDLGKHEETKGHMGMMIGQVELMKGRLGDSESMRTFIKGFN